MYVWSNFPGFWDHQGGCLLSPAAAKLLGERAAYMSCRAAFLECSSSFNAAFDNYTELTPCCRD